MIPRTTFIAPLLLAVISALGVEGSSMEKRVERQELSRRQTGIDAICWWESPSSAIIRDQVYINGGILQLANITDPLATPQIATDTNIPTLSYYINLGNGFNVSDVPFQTIDTNFAQVFDGFMAANDNSFWLYGGLVPDTDAIRNFPDSNDISVYDVYRQGVERVWNKGWQIGSALSEGVTRFVAAGAGVNVRDLNQTYYFSGAHHKGWSEIRGGLGVRDKYRANITTAQFIRGDLTDQQDTKWTNLTTKVPKSVRPRVNAEMVYVPVGGLGALVVVGGVMNADWMDLDKALSSKDYNAAVDQAVETGPNFLRTVEIYDINSDKWYLQNTTGDIPPTGLAKHCAVVASAQDGTSHQIYVYGGYPGQTKVEPIKYSDDVYVLSLPAFEWIKVHNGTATMARQGHKCVKPLPDQMMVIGGRPQARTMCTEMVRVFNLNTLDFVPAYDPAVYDQYKVPQVIRDVIGGDELGGATKVPRRWANPDLETMFLVDRPPTLAQTWYPYSPAAATGTPTSTVNVIQTKSEVPKYVYPVVGVCVFLLLAIVGGCITFFYIRRKRQRQAAILAGHEQFQKEEKGIGYDTYPQYPSHTSPYGTANSMTTLGAYGHSRQMSTDGYSIEHPGSQFHELPTDRIPVELEGGIDVAKLAVVQENSDAFSIVPTPATEASDPMSGTQRQPSTRTARRSVFSEEAITPTDDSIVSPLSPDPQMPASLNAQINEPPNNNGNGNGWWRKMSAKGSRGVQRFGSFGSSGSSKSPPKSPS